MSRLSGDIAFYVLFIRHTLPLSNNWDHSILY